MIIKITNKDEKFYEYMGKFFGSRLVEKQTNDRIYDDDDKQWYLFLEDEKVKAFVSVNKNTIKNIYATNSIFLEKILQKIQDEIVIAPSIVTNCYIEIYEKCGLKIMQNQNYKNFVTIYSRKDEK